MPELVAAVSFFPQATAHQKHHRLVQVDYLHAISAAHRETKRPATKP